MSGVDDWAAQIVSRFLDEMSMDRELARRVCLDQLLLWGELPGIELGSTIRSAGSIVRQQFCH
jgi:hypothetical protein